MTHKEYESKSQMKRVEILKAEEKQMTHEELRAKIDEHIDYGICGVCDGKCYKEENIPWLALRAVVELAITAVNGNPNTAYSMGYAAACERIIKAIEKELS